MTGMSVFEVFIQIKEQFDEWAKMKFSVLDANKLELGCNTLRNTLKKLTPECTITIGYEFCKVLIENYKETIPLLTNLKSDALRQRHWK